MGIEKVDENLVVKTEIQEDNLKFYDVRKDPFRVYGLYDYQNQEQFRRLPQEVAENTSREVEQLAAHTSGGRVRFRTNSKYIAIQAKMPTITRFPHMTLAGSSGFDLYINKKGSSTFYKTFMPPVDMIDGYESIHYFENSEIRDVTIHFPLYNEVKDLYIGLEEGAMIESGGEYSITKPIVFYGSSITQGGCASRPGNSYTAMVSRMIDGDFINLGFSGSGKAEIPIAEYIASLEMSVFVCDYDYNASTVEYLEQTHNRLYSIIRDKNKELPIVFLSKPNFDMDPEVSIKRRNVIYQTYIQAKTGGDDQVYFVDGYHLFGSTHRDSCTVDSVHPNDLGFMRMAEALHHTLQLILS